VDILSDYAADIKGASVRSMWNERCVPWWRNVGSMRDGIASPIMIITIKIIRVVGCGVFDRVNIGSSSQGNARKWVVLN
jgi:hypothetical protein